MANIKLTYFDARGRAETSRLILAYAGVQYVDQRLTSEQFASVKSKMPWGQLPALKYNGHIICQSNAIARFLAAEFDLVGTSNAEAAQADEIVDRIQDLHTARFKAVFASDEGKKAELMRELREDIVPAGLTQLEKKLEERGGQFLVGNQLSWADLALFAFYDIMGSAAHEVLEGYPLLKDLAERIAELPNIANWLTSRPVTVM